MTWAVVTMLSVFMALFLTGCAAVVYVFTHYVSTLQTKFFQQLDKKDLEAEALRSSEAEKYAQFTELQAQREAVISAADKEWLESPLSVTPPDRDLDWESE